MQPVSGKVSRRTPPSHVQGSSVQCRPDIVVGGQDLVNALGHEGVLGHEDVRAACDLRNPFGRARSYFRGRERSERIDLEEYMSRITRVFKISKIFPHMTKTEISANNLANMLTRSNRMNL